MNSTLQIEDAYVGANSFAQGIAPISWRFSLSESLTVPLIRASPFVGGLDSCAIRVAKQQAELFKRPLLMAACAFGAPIAELSEPPGGRYYTTDPQTHIKIRAANLCHTRQIVSATLVIARNNVTKQSRSEEPVSEIAAVAALPRNDGVRRNPWLFGQNTLKSSYPPAPSNVRAQFFK
jgi:hypothetical protein